MNDKRYKAIYALQISRDQYHKLIDVLKLKINSCFFEDRIEFYYHRSREDVITFREIENKFQLEVEMSKGREIPGLIRGLLRMVKHDKLEDLAVSNT